MDELAALLEQRPGFLAVWVFVFGAIIGSFLNVVVYRLPRGLSLNHPPSRCPRCEHKIRWYHNVPIFGWLLLRGKCYDCGAKISARYPLVELTTGAIFVALAYFDVYLQWTTTSKGLVAPSTDLIISMVAVLVAHLIAACCLLSAALIRWDGQRVPNSILIMGIAGSVLVLLFASHSIEVRIVIQTLLIAGFVTIGGSQYQDDLAH